MLAPPLSSSCCLGLPRFKVWDGVPGLDSGIRGVPWVGLLLRICAAAPCRRLDNKLLTGPVPAQLSALSSLREL